MKLGQTATAPLSINISTAQLLLMVNLMIFTLPILQKIGCRILFVGTMNPKEAET